MSDGPHRSLNMRRGWKRFAKRADKEAYAPEEVCDAIPAALAAANGKAGQDALTEAASASLMDRATRGILQVEEHYYRESSHKRSVNVRERMNSGIAQTDFGAIARNLIGTGKAQRPQSVAKRTGVDDGVSL